MTDYISFGTQLHNHYNRYRETSLTHRRFKHDKVVELIKALPNNVFNIEVVGKSFQQRDIYLVSAGYGSTNILLWSQMHGDEATATAALFDMFHFLAADDEFNPIRQQIFSKFTLWFVPMLNPDGAEVYTRRTSQLIDMNRDAQRLQTPEARLLKSLRDRLQPPFGFNLHDQVPYYSAGDSPRPATISFLAPSFDAQRSVDARRLDTMKLIVCMNDVLQQFIPQCVGKYSDAFEPRAFGDSMQRWGTNCVLVESGGYYNDAEKQYPRKLNFVSVLAGLQVLATNAHVDRTESEYIAIPDNKTLKLFDVLLRNVSITSNNGTFIADIGVRRYDAIASDVIGTRGVVDDVGDLSTFYAYDDLTMSSIEARTLQVYPETLPDTESVCKLPLLDLVKRGFGIFRVAQPVVNEAQRNTLPIPVGMIGTTETLDAGWEFGKRAFFGLWQQNELKAAVLNGFLVKM